MVAGRGKAHTGGRGKVESRCCRSGESWLAFRNPLTLILDGLANHTPGTRLPQPLVEQVAGNMLRCLCLPLTVCDVNVFLAVVWSRCQSDISGARTGHDVGATSQENYVLFATYRP